MSIGIVGAGVIGAGWVARFVVHGRSVRVFDPQADEHRVRATVDAAASRLQDVYDVPLPAPGALEFADTLADAVRHATWVQESTPEVLQTKQQLLADIEKLTPPEAIIASSTSGFTPSALSQDLTRPERMLVCHPFNPVYLLPLVEVVSCPDSTAVAEAQVLLQAVGMKPLHLRREIDAHIADRLLEAVWREALWLVRDGVATTGQIDDAIRFGFGLRWAQMGLFETYRLGGGEQGMRHFLQQFGPALQWPWSRLTDVPELDDALIERIAQQTEEHAAGASVQAATEVRDRNLVAILRALKETGAGAGAHLAAWEAGVASD